jgi:hypothetical protein
VQRRSLELFISKVMPHFRGRTSPQRASGVTACDKAHTEQG